MSHCCRIGSSRRFSRSLDSRHHAGEHAREVQVIGQSDAVVAGEKVIGQSDAVVAREKVIGQRTHTFLLRAGKPDSCHHGRPLGLTTR